MRNGNERECKIRLLESTMRICEREPSLIEQIQHSCDGTLQLSANVFEEMKDIYKKERYYEMGLWKDVDLGLRTLKKAYESNKEERIRVLLCANSMQPGDSAVKGGVGMIESLCRSTTLYSCLYTEKLQKEFFFNKVNDLIRKGERYYLYIPNVVGIRDVDKEDMLLPKEEWYYFDVIYSFTNID